MIGGGEPGGEMTLQCEWEEKRIRNEAKRLSEIEPTNEDEEWYARHIAEEMKKLSGEPYQVFTHGVGWHDADKPRHPPAVRQPAVHTEAERACCRDTPTRRPGPCGGDSCG